eukprot:Nitzschia sp. Nitz4//scaffold130_size63480//28605//29444//NITZ4_006248-RA/size63480-processed-gene-0.16-mRNA-1//1//CDS//3329535186//8646//frame0
MSMLTKISVRLIVAIVAILIPVPLALYLHKRNPKVATWGTFGTGSVTFIVSQVFHIPFNLVILHKYFNDSTDHPWTKLICLSIFLGLSAGVFEEVSRYLFYRFRLTGKHQRTYDSALMFGAGHGGIESIIFVGIAGLTTLVEMKFIWNHQDDLPSIGIPEDKVEEVLEEMHTYWDQPWYQVMLSDLERVFAITCHLALAVLVLQCFQRHSAIWLPVAIFWHAGLDFTAVILTATTSIYETEMVVGLWAIGSYCILQYFRPNPDPTASERSNVVESLLGY